MFTKALSGETLRALEKLGKSKILSKAYLAGGTALALHIGHRESIDLDFFTNKVFNEKVLIKKLEELGKFEKEEIAQRTVLGRFMKVKFSIFYYKYPLLEKVIDFKGVKVVGKKDIAVMKLQAIGDRGTKRDFIDLFFLCKELELREVFDLYGKKFGKLKERKYHLLRGLKYFEDAERDVMPKMYKKVNWEKVAEYFDKEVDKLLKEWKIV